jgi:ArsR family transcriptional regulator
VKIAVPVQLYQAKAEFFRTLGHPARIRILELLQNGPRPVKELIGEMELEPSSMSQQLAVLRRAGLVISERDGHTVVYKCSTPEVGNLLRAARGILTEVLADQGELLTELRTRPEPGAG